MSLPRTPLLASALLLLAAAALVVLAHNVQTLGVLDPSAQLGFGRGERIVFLPVDPAVLLPVAYGLALLTGGVFLVAYLKYAGLPRRLLLLELVPLLVIALLLVAMAVLIVPVEPDEVVPEENGEEPGADPGTPPPTDPADPSDPSGPVFPLPGGLLLAGMGLAGLLAVLLLFLLVRYRVALPTGEEPWEVEETEEVRREAAQAVERSISDLELGEDVRSVILRCYRDMVVLFRARGLGAGRHLTAREVEDLARQALRLTGGSAGALRALFEEARYSHHELLPDHRSRALEALRAVERELGA